MSCGAPPRYNDLAQTRGRGDGILGVQRRSS